MAVDATCIVPMNLAQRGYDRAYAFRDALIEAFEARVDTTWPDAPQATGHAGDVGFDAVDCGPLSAARFLEPFAMTWIHLAFKQGMGRQFAFALLRR